MPTASICQKHMAKGIYTDPDNYTDPPTFLSHLQRNPRLRPYDFWPLVADSTVIVQHISSVAIFVCSFVAIYQQRMSPVSVVSWGSAGTVLGYVLWDFWVGQEAALKVVADHSHPVSMDFISGSVNGGVGYPPTTTTAPTSSADSSESSAVGLGLNFTASDVPPRRAHSHSQSQSSVLSRQSPTLSRHPSNLSLHPTSTTTHTISHTYSRLATVKSAIIITVFLLGVSPILKSLTESTSSDSIWAMAFCLLCINMLFFNYSGGVAVEFPADLPTKAAVMASTKFPASLSTCGAVMASTVLASRLPSTTHVFSLMLFSIEVFGLFPVFRRHLRHINWKGHLTLTLALVIGAGAGMGLTVSGMAFWYGGWKRAISGASIWGLGSAIGMGGCCWWFIGLQRYKNVVTGPWDPARPVIKGGQWE